ncbi:MAG: A24 family peptidase [Lachnospiraceae bacterium]|nr:A24 family peptidase [Lachnospiraceae bacterium]
MDYKHDRIPNGIIMFGTAIGFLSHSRGNGWQCILSAGVAILISFCILYPLFRIGGIGAGDVKLLLMTGSYFSVDMQLHIMMFSFIIGALLSIEKMISEDNFKERMQYLCSYMMDLLRTGQWKLYGENLSTNYHKYKSNKIHFALPIFLSVMLGLGGIF